MPGISRFHGIVVSMYYNEHAPPHFHASCKGHKMRVEIETGEILSGRFPSSAARLVLEWQRMHRRELMEDWCLARSRKPLKAIAPLE